MTDLNRLMTLPGAQAAFVMNDRGELQQHLLAEGTALNETALDLLAHMCVANNAIATMQARGWEASSESHGFYPVDGFLPDRHGVVGDHRRQRRGGRRERGSGLRIGLRTAERTGGGRVIKQMLAVDGVAAVCRFRDDGAFVEGYGLLSEQELVALAHFAHEYKRIVQGNADQLSMFTRIKGWTPPGGWVVRGARMSVCSVANLVCTVENADSNLSEVMEQLIETSYY